MLLFLLALLCGEAFADSKTIYQDDDRLEFFQLKGSSYLKRYAPSVGLIVGESLLEDYSGGHKRLLAHKYGRLHDLCPNERFFHQPSIGLCTAFLIGKDLMMSAGHCVRGEGYCQRLGIVFGYFYKSKDQELGDVLIVPDEKVYACEQIVRREYDFAGNIDYVIFRLDRAVLDLTPLVLGTENNYRTGLPVSVIGYPRGLPQKTVAKAFIKRNHKNSFRANFDAFTVNSGSPVFDDQSEKVIGIHIRGGSDFGYDEQKNCYFSRRCLSNGCAGERAMKVGGRIVPKLP